QPLKVDLQRLRTRGPSTPTSKSSTTHRRTTLRVRRSS
ncbi:uncharacterized protein METZ01_LOCUS394477, partial [marine metagenome]